MFKRLKGIYKVLSFGAFLALVKLAAPAVMMLLAGTGAI